MWFNLPAKRRPTFRLALLGVVLAVGVIMLGAYTRLVDAGLGCPDWPTCYGHVLWPTSAEDVDAANARFADTPVEHDKTWPEQVHRLFASTLGLVGLVLFALAVRHREPGRPWRLLAALLVLLVAGVVARAVIGDWLDPWLWGLVGLYFATVLAQRWRYGASRQPLLLPAFLAGFLVLQGLFGMWTVTLKVWPQVVTAHLLGGFATLGLFWLLALFLNNQVWWFPASSVRRLAVLRPWALAVTAIVVVQITLGGWTTSNYADVACPDLPTCQGAWWPSMNLVRGFDVFQAIGPNYLGGQLDNEARVAIHMMHRLGGIVTWVAVLALAGGLWRTAIVEARRLAGVLAALVTLQVLLGLGNILFRFPVAVAVAHNLGGALLLLGHLTLLHRLYTVESR